MLVHAAHLARGRLLRPALRSPALHAHAIRTRRCLLSTTGSTAEAEAGWTSDLSWVVDMLQFGAFVALVNHYVISMTQCIGPSMKPTLTSAGDIVLLWPGPMARLLHGGPQLGDVVIATSPADPSQSVCKRVVGMPGDVVRVPPAPWARRDDRRREVDVPRGAPRPQTSRRTPRQPARRRLRRLRTRRQATCGCRATTWATRPTRATTARCRSR